MALRTIAFESPSFAGEVEQDHRHAGVGKMRSDLRAHDAGTEHRDLAHEEGESDMLKPVCSIRLGESSRAPWPAPVIQVAQAPRRRANLRRGCRACSDCS